MIPVTTLPGQPPRWQQLLADAIADPAELLTALNLGRDWLPAAHAAARLFPLRVPRGFVARMQPGNAADPLLRQVLPLGEELEETPGYGPDPVGDLAVRIGPGVLHKYQGRTLLVTTGACAVHCRYCFRRHFPYGDENPRRGGWDAALAALVADTSIEEVILSGGDPLSLSDARLAELVAGIEAIPHVRRLRLHTRLPVVLPERVDERLLGWLAGTRLQKVVVIHANHANELATDVAAALARLADAGCTLLNQSVLLRGVNDDASTLAALSERLFASGVLPYYLHMLDRVAGAAHFAVADDAARGLLETLRNRLPGYLVPRLVREVAGEPSKLPM